MFKSLIKKYLYKKLNVAHPKNYYFLRWLVELVRDKNRTFDAYGAIVGFLYNRQQDMRTNVYETYPFTDIFVIDNYVYIYTRRPGMWIGKGGETLDAVEKRLNYNSHGDLIDNYKIRILEDTNSAMTYIREGIKIMVDNW